ncbi:MAG: gamma-glutamyl-gamma-aminobutyrate hydrolase family protein [Alphaproteobacteria bacterium]|nr:gamma-glutamyl-gamma-aminobutyrate hydrolase family protein [Alphaproteobacteria bacterium]
MKKPVIGLTLDWMDEGGYSKYPWYAMRENYCTAVAQAGGSPILLPHHEEEIEAYLNVIDGLIITGGDFDVDPALYGQVPSHPRVLVKEKRCKFEYLLTKKALELDIPLLGICGGHQLLNVVLGGVLIQHIPAEYETSVAHEQRNPRHESGHSIVIHPQTRLAQIVEQSEALVNSAHHQAIKSVADGVIVNAIASDGIIEGIEDPRRHFCMGVQWHPEFHISEVDRRIFRALITASAA